MVPILAATLPPTVLITVVVVVILVFSLLLMCLARYRRCPSDKVMVIYGKKVGQNKDGTARSARCIHGGAAFIWPVFQSYEYLDLTPMSISVDLQSALSRQNIRIDVPARFTVGISTESGTMQNAAERLLGLKLQEIQELAEGHHLRPAAPRDRHHGHRGDQHRPRQIPRRRLLQRGERAAQDRPAADQRQRHRHQR